MHLAATARWLAIVGDVVRRAASPWLVLVIRIWLGQAFLVAQLTAIMLGGSFEGPLQEPWWQALFRHAATSTLGAAIGALCPLLLIAGLITRPAAIALLLQTLLLPAQDAPQDAPALSSALLIWIAVNGPGPISLDALLSPGLRSIAVPGLHRLVSLGQQLLRPARTVYLLLLRVWIAAALAAAALSAPIVLEGVSAGWLPHMPGMAADLAPAGALILAALLALGFATRPAAVILLLLAPISTVHTVGDVRLYWLLLLAVLVTEGPGAWSLDHAFAARVSRMRSRSSAAHVVIVGGGFGGIAAASRLRDAACQVTLIDRCNYTLFQPLLYQVATAALSPADIATPIRALFRNQSNVRVMLGEVTGVDPETRTVHLHKSVVPYDYLILATGARHSYFGHDEWMEAAPGLKGIEDATRIRRRLLLAFEAAETAADPVERAAWLTFVIVGGGPTGVELAGAIAELARHGLEGEFRNIDPSEARVILVQAGDRILPGGFSPVTSAAATASLQALGVEVRLNEQVTDITPDAAVVGGATVPARTILWAAGVTASPAAEWLHLTGDRAGRLIVGPDLSVPGHPDIFAIGDTVASDGWAGKPVPGLAPAAKQGGVYVARQIARRIAGRPTLPPFRYHHFGSLATIGRQSAVAEFGPIRLHGAIAWWLWGAAHIAFLAGGRNRISVLVEWLWAYLTFRRGTRLITGTN